MSDVIASRPVDERIDLETVLEHLDLIVEEFGPSAAHPVCKHFTFDDTALGFLRDLQITADVEVNGATDEDGNYQHMPWGEAYSRTLGKWGLR